MCLAVTRGSNEGVKLKKRITTPHRSTCSDFIIFRGFINEIAKESQLRFKCEIALFFVPAVHFMTQDSLSLRGFK